MGCNCGKRGKLIGAAIKAAQTGKPVKPLVNGIVRTVQTDLKTLRANATKIISPRFR